MRTAKFKDRDFVAREQYGSAATVVMRTRGSPRHVAKETSDVSMETSEVAEGIGVNNPVYQGDNDVVYDEIMEI